MDHGAVIRRHELFHAEWEFVRPLLPESLRGQEAAGRPPAGLNGIAWKFRTGTSWRDVPERYGPWACLRVQLPNHHECRTGPMPITSGQGRERRSPAPLTACGVALSTYAASYRRIPCSNRSGAAAAQIVSGLRESGIPWSRAHQSDARDQQHPVCP
ncbi:transposase [Streptomyces tanashiensis]|uniref:transposase n=1 Tax=Streptomyces tanashiensis TaxID=67367 RepID=UPI00167E46C6